MRARPTMHRCPCGAPGARGHSGSRHLPGERCGRLRDRPHPGRRRRNLGALPDSLGAQVRGAIAIAIDFGSLFGESRDRPGPQRGGLDLLAPGEFEIAPRKEEHAARHLVGGELGAQVRAQGFCFGRVPSPLATAQSTTISPRLGCGTPTACALYSPVIGASAASISRGDTFAPPVLIRLESRPSQCSAPSASSQPASWV